MGTYVAFSPEIELLLRADLGIELWETGQEALEDMPCGLSGEIGGYMTSLAMELTNRVGKTLTVHCAQVYRLERGVGPVRLGLRGVQESTRLVAKRSVLNVLIREAGPYRLAEEQHVADIVP